MLCSSFRKNASVLEKIMMVARRSLGRVARAPARQMSAASLNYCVDLVAAHDRERYLCNLHAPAHARAGLFALHAFNYEIARIRTTTSGEGPARGRIDWWRRALQDALDGAPPEHPVARAVAHAHAQHGFTTRYLTQILDARQADLHMQQPRDLEQLREYCENTAGSLLLLGLECAGVKDDEAAEIAASQAGTALGIATLLRGTVAHASQGCTYLPTDVTTRHGVRLSSVRAPTLHITSHHSPSHHMVVG